MTVVPTRSFTYEHTGRIFRVTALADGYELLRLFFRSERGTEHTVPTWERVPTDEWSDHHAARGRIGPGRATEAA
jgi:hypothetical protein